MWPRSYLSERTQIVRVQSFQSMEIRVPSGVPQGLHLGPLLFNIYVNDIPACFLHSRFLMFADDLKFFMRVHDGEDCFKLQSDLDRLVHWYDFNGMELNVGTYHLMVFGSGRNPVQQVYDIGGSPLDSVSQIRDLRVVLDSHLA